MRKLMKIISVFCLVALLAGCGQGENQKKPQKKSEVAVTIGKTDYDMERFNIYFYTALAEQMVAAEVQTAEDVTEDFWTQEVDGTTRFELAKQNALTTMINDSVALEKAKKLGLELTGVDINNINTEMENVKADSATMARLEAIGVSIDAFAKYYEDGILIQYLIPELISNGEIDIDEDEIDKNFKNDYVKAKHILISTTDPNTGAALADDQVAAANTKAQSILDQIRGGADFDELMNANSEDPGLQTAPDGYVFTKGQMVAEFESAAFALAEGQVSGLVNTDYGIHIIKRIPLNVGGAQEMQIIQSLQYEAAYPQIEELIKVWKAKEKIKTNDDALGKAKPFSTEAFFGA